MKKGVIFALLAAMVMLTACGLEKNKDIKCGECPLLTPPGPEFCQNGNIVGGGVNECGCQQPPSCEATVACQEDAKICDDGTTLVRDPNNNCTFPACPEKIEGNLKENYCTPEQRGNVACTMDYTPVCGWFGKEIQCIKYPCAATYGNKCGACADDKVAYWTQGECPTDAPTPQETDEFRNYVNRNTTVCAATTWLCEVNETQQFFDETGCGCEATEPKKIVSDDPEKCKAIRYMCVKNYVPYSDETGCGCKFDWASVAELVIGGKIKATDCTDPRPDACTKEYMPVCGQMEPNCKGDNCTIEKKTFGNKCDACSDRNTISWYAGACEQE